MINANELRLGNWVDLGEIESLQFQIESISKDGVNRTETYGYPDEPGGVGPYVDFISFDSINGIPLKPEILEKCGFKFIPEFVYWDKSKGQVFKREKWLLTDFYDGVGYGISWHHYPSDQQSTLGIRISSVHQLQNLYFALTGQELEVNL